MKVLIGVDVDPVLPRILHHRPSGDIWEPLDLIPRLQSEMGADFPRMTWLIRADQSIELASGGMFSGFLARRAMWEQLQAQDHELGWHMHYLTGGDGPMAFDPDPAWLPAAFSGLSRFYPVRAVRTGWDYGSNAVFRRLREFDVALDFSALPGALVFADAGSQTLQVDWRRSPERPYFPAENDYQSPSLTAGRLMELPITQFASDIMRSMKRFLWRTLHGKLDLRGMRRCTRLLTEPWPDLPEKNSFGVWAFFYHPDELTDNGRRNVARNLAMMRESGAEFVTASQAEAYLRKTFTTQMCAIQG